MKIKETENLQTADVQNEEKSDGICEKEEKKNEIPEKINKQYFKKCLLMKKRKYSAVQ